MFLGEVSGCFCTTLDRSFLSRHFFLTMPLQLRSTTFFLPFFSRVAKLIPLFRSLFSHQLTILSGINIFTLHSLPWTDSKWTWPSTAPLLNTVLLEQTISIKRLSASFQSYIMAVIEDLGLEVSILIDGTPVTEYEDPEPARDGKYPADMPISHKYIESKDDTEYVIECKALAQHRWHSLEETSRLSFRAYVDGMSTERKAVSPKTLTGQILGPRPQVLGGGESMRSNFKFNPVTLGKKFH